MDSFIDIEEVVAASNDKKNTIIPVELSLQSDLPKEKIPKVIELSLLAIDYQNKTSRNSTVIVFPEKKILGPIFTIAKSLHEIINGKVKNEYSLNSFKKGDKISFNKKICKFIETDGKNVKIEFKDGVVSSVPVDHVHLFFQKVKSEKKLSKYNSPTNTTHLKENDPKLALVEELCNYKTHMKKSIVYLTSIVRMTEFLSKGAIEDNQLKKIFLLSKSDYKGNLTNLFDSKLDGIPSILLCSDVYCIKSLIQNQHPITSIVIDTTVKNIEDNLSDYNRLSTSNIPLIFLTDFTEYPDLVRCLGHDRVNYLIWNSNNLRFLIKENYSLGNPFTNKIPNYTNREVNYLTVECCELSNAISILERASKLLDKDNSDISDCLNELRYICFFLSKQITPLTIDSKLKINKKIDEIKEALKTQVLFASKELSEDFSTVIDLINKLISSDFHNLKNQKIKDYITNSNTKDFFIVLDKNKEVLNTQNYWNAWCNENKLQKKINVISYSEYTSTDIPNGITILPFFGKESVMRKILYGFNTRTYIVILYKFEESWYISRNRRWNYIFKESYDPLISISNAHNKTIKPKLIHAVQSENEEYTTNIDEYDSFENNIFQSLYSKYKNKNTSKEETNDVIPVSFAGGGLSLFPLRHKILVVTNLILGNSNLEARQLFASELSVGDFIAIASRDSAIDLVKQYANKSPSIISARKLAKKWKEAIKILAFFENNQKKIIDKIIKSGCKKNRQTVKNWLEADCICPQDIDDLKCIAKATGDDVLKEKTEEIFNAGKLVIKAHQQAGRDLSIQLQKEINNELKKQHIDPINFWDPIQINIENCDVKIFKIIDIGQQIKVEKKFANKLIYEW